MNYFLQNFIKGGASINLSGASHNNSIYLSRIENHLIEITKRANQEKISVKKAIEKEFFEKMIGQFTIFIAVISLILLTVWMVSVNIPDSYCLLVILISQLILFLPKLIIYYYKLK